MEHIKTDDTVYFTANFYHPVSGQSINPDTTPRYLVYENDTVSSILEGDLSARSDYVGSYFGYFTASAANGFDSNSFYDVQVSGAVNDRHAMVSVKQFVLDDVFDSNLVQISGHDFQLADIVDANTVQISGEYVSLGTTNDLSTFDADSDKVYLGDGAHGGASAGLTLSDYSDFKATGFSTTDDILSASGAIENKIDNLNNLSTADIDTALTDYDGATRTQLISVSGSLSDSITALSGDVSSLQSDVDNLDQDIYFANIKYIRDNTNAQDEYGVQWFKNDQPVSSSNLESPAISVYDTNDGSALIEHQLMSPASPTLGVVRYNESSSLMTSGEPYLIETSGTIDASVRVWKYIVGIDKL